VPTHPRTILDLMGSFVSCTSRELDKPYNSPAEETMAYS
jgi:hypothetical protein